LSDMFTVKNGLKQEDSLSPFPFICAVEYAIRRVQVNQDGLKLNGTHQLLVYAEDVNILTGSVQTIKKNSETLVVARKETGLEVNGDKPKYMVRSQTLDAGRNHSIKFDNSSFQRVEEFKYLGTTITNQNSIQNYNFPVVLYGCETWSLTREKHRLGVFENRVLRRIFGPKWDDVTGEWRKLHNEELNALYYSLSIVQVIKSRRMIWTGHVARMGRRVVYRVLVGKPEERDHMEDPGVDGRIILRWIFRKWDVGTWTGSSWLRIGVGGRHV